MLTLLLNRGIHQWKIIVYSPWLPCTITKITFKRATTAYITFYVGSAVSNSVYYSILIYYIYPDENFFLWSAKIQIWQISTLSSQEREEIRLPQICQDHGQVLSSFQVSSTFSAFSVLGICVTEQVPSWHQCWMKPLWVQIPVANCTMGPHDGTLLSWLKWLNLMSILNRNNVFPWDFFSREKCAWTYSQLSIQVKTHWRKQEIFQGSMCFSKQGFFRHTWGLQHPCPVWLFLGCIDQMTKQLFFHFIDLFSTLLGNAALKNELNVKISVLNDRLRRVMVQKGKFSELKLKGFIPVSYKKRILQENPLFP